MDPVAMYAAVAKAREYAIEHGPVLIEAFTYTSRDTHYVQMTQLVIVQMKVSSWKKKIH